MSSFRLFVKIALSGVICQTALLPILPVRAQDAPPKKQARIVIRTPDGEQVIDLDPNNLPDMGDGDQMLAVKVGPDGKVMTFRGSPGMNVAGGVAGPNGMIGMKGITIIYPGRSYLLPLLKREDVQAQLFLSPRQREALDALENSQQQAMQQQMKQSVLPLPGEIAGKSKEELRAFFTERAVKMREEMQSLDNNHDKKMTAILTPTQWSRLKELDLQWRGPLAMGVKSVAEQAKLTPQQAPAVEDLLKQYRQEVDKHLGAGVKTVAFTPKPGAGGASSARIENPPSATTPAEMQANMEKIAKEIEKARKLLGEKALNTLTNEQRAQWAALTGKPFIFRN